MKQKISFTYPLTNMNVIPAKHICDLYVSVVIETDINGNTEIEIRKITHFAKGEGFGSDVKELLQYLNHRIYMEVIEAAKNHANSLIADRETIE